MPEISLLARSKKNMGGLNAPIPPGAVTTTATVSSTPENKRKGPRSLPRSLAGQCGTRKKKNIMISAEFISLAHLIPLTFLERENLRNLLIFPGPPYECHFQTGENANFFEATFKKITDFTWRANFKESVDFRGAIFEKEANYAGQFFAGGIFFRAIYEEGSFSGAIFMKEANFSKANYHGRVVFSGPKSTRRRNSRLSSNQLLKRDFTASQVYSQIEAQGRRCFFKTCHWRK